MDHDACASNMFRRCDFPHSMLKTANTRLRQDKPYFPVQNNIPNNYCGGTIGEGNTLEMRPLEAPTLLTGQQFDAMTGKMSGGFLDQSRDPNCVIASGQTGLNDGQIDKVGFVEDRWTRPWEKTLADFNDGQSNSFARFRAKAPEFELRLSCRIASGRSKVDRLEWFQPSDNGVQGNLRGDFVKHARVYKVLGGTGDNNPTSEVDTGTLDPTVSRASCEPGNQRGCIGSAVGSWVTQDVDFVGDHVMLQMSTATMALNTFGAAMAEIRAFGSPEEIGSRSRRLTDLQEVSPLAEPNFMKVKVQPNNFMAETRTSVNGWVIGAVASAVAGIALVGISARRPSTTEPV